jgi:NADH-quinone oxidoreductase subunit E
MSPAQIMEVASFYTMLFLKPVGKNVLWVCHNLSCNLCGAEDVIQHLEKSLGVRAGETTADGLFTLFRQECLASCDTAPMMQVNDDFEENLTLKRVDEIIDKLRSRKEA